MWLARLTSAFLKICQRIEYLHHSLHLPIKIQSKFALLHQSALPMDIVKNNSQAYRLKFRHFRADHSYWWVPSGNQPPSQGCRGMEVKQNHNTWATQTCLYCSKNIPIPIFSSVDTRWQVLEQCVMCFISVSCPRFAWKTVGALGSAHWDHEAVESHSNFLPAGKASSSS